MIPLSEPYITGNEWVYIKDCLDTGWVSSVGSYVDRFENNVANLTQTKYAVATVNGTAALHISLIVSDIGADDEVFIPTLTFIAPANAIRYVGAWPIFIDSDLETGQLDINKLIFYIENNCHYSNGILTNNLTGRRIKGVIPVHILGHPVDMDPLNSLALKYNLIIIEDATESLGATYKNKPVGNLGHIACFSFNGNKLITTGGGGMIVTNNEAWAKKSKYLTTQAKDDGVEFIHNEIGYNFRLTNIQAAFGCAQVEKINAFIKKKRQIASIYKEAIQQIPGLKILWEQPWAFSTFWLITILVDEAKYGIDSRKLLHIMSKNNIQTRPLWAPIHLNKPYQNCSRGNVSVAENLNRMALCLPCSVGLTDEQIKKVIGVLSNKI